MVIPALKENRDIWDQYVVGTVIISIFIVTSDKQ